MESSERSRPAGGRRLVTAVATVTAFLAAAACGTQAADGSATAGQSSVAFTLPQGWATCENRVFGYEIGYPGSWFTTDILNGQRDPEFACQWFGPEPFDQVDEQGRSLGNVVIDGFGYPLEVFWAAQPLDAAVEPWTDSDRVEVLSREDVQVDGHPAVKLEIETLLDPMNDLGLHYLYVVELDVGRSIFVHTTEVRGIPGDYDENKRILDQAVQSIRFTESG